MLSRRSGWPRPGNHADSAFDAFIETSAVKYDKAAACLVKDRETMLAFYDFPAEHWKHLRTTNPEPVNDFETVTIAI